ncbi:MAG TPA: hypothetical protein PL001_06960, partial [Candidatus Kryptobacter bacterium]|nr:hypothetical protein [Candidatus Kryptobacter bacterium]
MSAEAAADRLHEMERTRYDHLAAAMGYEFDGGLYLRTHAPRRELSFLKMLLSGLNEFVPWDAELLFAAETSFQREPILYSRASLPRDPYAAKSMLEAMLESGSLKLAKAFSGKECHPLLIPLASHQL